MTNRLLPVKQNIFFFYYLNASPPRCMWPSPARQVARNVAPCNTIQATCIATRNLYRNKIAKRVAREIALCNSALRVKSMLLLFIYWSKRLTRLLYSKSFICRRHLCASILCTSMVFSNEKKNIWISLIWKGFLFTWELVCWIIYQQQHQRLLRHETVKFAKNCKERIFFQHLGVTRGEFGEI